jgi:hypothetical protein
MQSSWASWLALGWVLSGVITIKSGTTLHFTADGKSLAANCTKQTPIQIAPFHELGGIDNALWFDPSAFCPVVISPPLIGLPSGRQRRARQHGTLHIQRSKAPHFTNPKASFTSPTFGYVTGTSDQNGNVGDGNRVLELKCAVLLLIGTHASRVRLFQFGRIWREYRSMPRRIKTYFTHGCSWPSGSWRFIVSHPNQLQTYRWGSRSLISSQQLASLP